MGTHRINTTTIVGRIEKNKVVEFDHFKKIHISLKIIYNKLQKLYNVKKVSNTTPFLFISSNQKSKYYNQPKPFYQYQMNR